MDLWDWSCGVHGLGEGDGVLEEVGVSSSQDASVPGVKLYVDYLLVLGAGYGDGGGKTDFNRGVNGGEHGV